MTSLVRHMTCFMVTPHPQYTPQAAKQCVTNFLESFPGIFPFTQLSLFDEGEDRIHDLCNKVARTMNGGSSLDDCK